jgi:diguanylate cyclase (GGDEF)-like protein/PAS domain S-box-containing protein
MTNKSTSGGAILEQRQLEHWTIELAAAQRIARMGFWRWDISTNGFAWSEELYRLVHLDPITFDVTLERTISLVHPEDRSSTQAILQASSTTGSEQEHEYRIVLNDGNVRHFWTNTQPICNDEGEVTEVRGICQDITDRVAAEAALRESEDHYRHAVELSPHIPWTADPAGNLLEVGPRWLDLMGMREQETLGEGWVRAVHPEDIDATIADWKRHLATGEPIDVEYRLRLVNGSYNWMRGRAAARRGVSGEIVRWYGTVEDIHTHKLAQLDLRESDQFSRSILRTSPDCIEVLDLEGHLLFMNEPGIRMREIEDFSAVIGKPWTGIWPEQEASTIRRAVGIAKSGAVAHFEGVCPTAAGTQKYWHVSLSIISNGEGEPSHLLAVSRDISEAKASADEVRAAHARLHAVLESTTDNVVIFDREWRLTYLNRNAQKAANYDPDQSKVLWEEYPELVFSDLHFELHRAVKQQTPVKFESFLLGLGAWFEVNAYPSNDGVTVFFRNITEARKAREEIVYLAHYDALTGLANRTMFNKQLQKAFVTADGAEISVLVLDLDGFKEINGRLGHALGDALLQDIAQRFDAQCSTSGLLARLGGGEFAIIHVATPRSGSPTELAERLATTLRGLQKIDGNRVEVGVNIGIATERRVGQEAGELLKKAYIATHQAKLHGRSACRVYEQSMEDELRARHWIKQELAEAIENGHLELQYQPLVDLRTGSITSFEALLRWRHPARGLISPADFIPIAEESGLIVPIGEWALRQACLDIKTLSDDVSVAVNLSPVQFRHGNLPLSVARALAESGLPSSRLEVEITETVLLHDTKQNSELLHSLRDLGISIALDDFGTGFSSLSYLRNFTFDKIKIDRSFVGDIGLSGHSEAIIRAVTGMAHALGLKVTAEGVETSAQHRWLADEGCDEVQGYLFSKPVPLQRAQHLVQTAESTAQWTLST